MRELHDNNETLFFALFEQNIEDLLPLVYTPTVGAGCQQFSQLFRKPRGLFLSLPHKRRLQQILCNQRFDQVEAVVVTDGERILGLQRGPRRHRYRQPVSGARPQRRQVRGRPDQPFLYFPGVGLGAVAVKARRITDAMFMAAAKALAAASPAASNPNENLLPPVTALREVAFAVALATAIQAHEEGLTHGIETDRIEAAIRSKIWEPRYQRYEPAGKLAH